ncbi:MAG TPA: CHASE3 domain-containing protein [Gemmatimonadaceae bacterium]|jgi:CHASE3 domain sensor protein
MQLTPVQKLSISIGAALVVLGGFGAASYYYASRLVAADRAVERANTNMAAAFHVVVSRQEGEHLAKAYVVRPDSVTRALLQAAQARVEDALDALHRGTEDNPRQFARVHALAEGAAQNFETFRSTVLIRDHVGADSARRVLTGERSANAADSLMKIVNEIREDELRVLGERTRLQNAHSATAQRVILVGMVLAFLLAGVALQPVRAHIASRLTSRIVHEHVTGAGVLTEADRARASATRQLQALHRLVADLSGAADRGVRAKALVMAAEPLNTVLVALIAPSDDGALRVLAASPSTLDGVGPDLERPVTELLRTGKATMAESRPERDRAWGDLPALDACGASGAVLFSPLTKDEQTTGVLVVAHTGNRVFPDDELIFAATLGRLGGAALAA